MTFSKQVLAKLISRRNINWGGNYIYIGEAMLLLGQHSRIKNAVNICSIYVEEKQKGHGTKAIKRLQRVVKSLGGEIHLSPVNYDKSIPMKKLREFYLNLGFKYVKNNKSKMCWK